MTPVPLLPWLLLGNIATAAGVHRYNEQGDFVWANEHFLALSAQSAGEHIVRFPRAVDVEDAYEGVPLGQGLHELRLKMALWQTQLLLIQESQS